MAFTMRTMGMRIAMLASECEPLAKTGGLADVVDALARALGRLSVEDIEGPVDVFLPRYRGVPELPNDASGADVPPWPGTDACLNRGRFRRAARRPSPRPGPSPSTPQGGLMLRASDRLDNVAPYALAKVFAARDAKLAQGVDVIDLGFCLLTVPAGDARRLLDAILPAEDHYARVGADDDPDLATS